MSSRPFGRTGVGIVGPGRAGIALAVALREAGVRLLGVHGRRRKRLPHGIKLTVGAAPRWLDRASVILLAVQDDEIAPLVKAWTQRQALRRGQVVLHLSGVRSSSVLDPLREHGVFIGGMHPLMTAMGVPDVDADNLAAATFALEGDAAAVRAGRMLAEAVGARSVLLDPAQRPRYHAGAVFAANYVTAMLATAEDLLVSAGFTVPAARAALLPLSGAALMNAAGAGPMKALTGPIVRGDTDTIRTNLKALNREERELYRAVGLATVALAQRAGRITARQAGAVKRAFTT
jgi:predicted short-subunit dehydrogenase-like oxidoreductase (DUF2520 family)